MPVLIAVAPSVPAVVSVPVSPAVFTAIPEVSNVIPATLWLRLLVKASPPAVPAAVIFVVSAAVSIPITEVSNVKPLNASVMPVV